MNVLITGAYGFLGRYTAKEFKEAGCYVVGIGHGKWHSDEYERWGIDKWVESTITFESLMNINEKFDIIVHCGGGASVAFSNDNPYEDFQKSVQSTLSLLEFIRLQCPECKLIYPSSPAVQGNLGKIQITEDLQSSPMSPYGVHKKIAEDLCLSYHKNFNVKVGVIRFFSVYGEGLQKQLLWDACRKIDGATEASFFGTGNETRDWIHVSDAVSLIRKFSAKLVGHCVINGGSGVQTEIVEIIKMLSKTLNKEVSINFNGKLKEGDPIHFWAEINRALLLDWKPEIDLESGLARYVEYYKGLKK